MRVFLSVASQDRPRVEDVALALRGEGHQVFLDMDDLPPGESYNKRIRQAIDRADLFIFFVSPASISPQRYTLTEMKLAQDKWPSPAGRVLPVFIAPTDPNAVPAYLRAVSIYTVRGNIAAEVANLVSRLEPGVSGRGSSETKPALRPAPMPLVADMWDVALPSAFFAGLGALTALIGNAAGQAFSPYSDPWLMGPLVGGAIFAALLMFMLFFFDFRSPPAYVAAVGGAIGAFLIGHYADHEMRDDILNHILIGSLRAGVLVGVLMIAIPQLKGLWGWLPSIAAGAIGGLFDGQLYMLFHAAEVVFVWEILVAGTLCFTLGAIAYSLRRRDDQISAERNRPAKDRLTPRTASRLSH